MANTLHLYRVGNTYYLRCRIPHDLQVWFNGISDHKRTLRTKNNSNAQSLLRMHSSRTETTFMMMRSGVLDDAQMRALAEEYINYGAPVKRTAISNSNEPAAGSVSSNQGAGKQRVNKDTLLSTIIEKFDLTFPPKTEPLQT